MTMKHINFDDSAVMRSLEKVAIKKGMFKPSVEEIVKTASVVEVPVGNLFDDIIRLAKGLRSKGFAKQAEVLEDKVFLYKQAETHLYRVFDEDGEDVLNFAHPDGNAVVSEAQEGLGEVETLQDAQRQMIDIARKQPAGIGDSMVKEVSKPAEKVLEAVKKALGLEKFAQEAAKSREEKILVLNDYIAKKWPEIASAVGKTIGVFGSLKYEFTYNNIVERPAIAQLYCSLLNIDYQNSFVKTTDKLNRFWGTKYNQNVDLIKAKIKNGEGKSFAEIISPELANIHFTGFTNGTGSELNPNSVYEHQWTSSDSTPVVEKNIDIVANKLYNIANTMLYDIVGPHLISAANAKIASFNIADIGNALTSCHEYFSNVFQISESETSISKHTDSLIGQKNLLSAFASNSKIGPSINNVLSVFNPENSLLSNIDVIVRMITEAINTFNANALSTKDVAGVDSAVKPMVQAFVIWSTAIDDPGFEKLNDKAKQAFIANRDITQEIIGALRSGTSFASIRKTLAAQGFEATSWEELNPEVAKWLEDSRNIVSRYFPNLAVKAAKEFDITKVAKGLTDPGAGAAGKPADGQKVQQPQQKGITKNPDVVKMQQELTKLLAGMHQIEEDGIWKPGGETDQALTAIGIIYGVQLKTMSSDPKASAKANMPGLAKATQISGGRPVVDVIEGAPIDVRYLRSLHSLYNLIQNKVEAQLDANGEMIININQLNTFVDKMVASSDTKSREMVRQSRDFFPTIMQPYYKAARVLKKNVDEIIARKSGKTTKDRDRVGFADDGKTAMTRLDKLISLAQDIVDPWEPGKFSNVPKEESADIWVPLSELGKGTGGGRPGRPQEQTGAASRKRQDSTRQYSTQDSEGEGFSTGATPTGRPFENDGSINLASAYFQGSGIDLESMATSRLSYERFRKAYSKGQLAQAIFKEGSVDEKEIQKRVLLGLGFSGINDSSWDNSKQQYIININGKGYGVKDLFNAGHRPDLKDRFESLYNEARLSGGVMDKMDALLLKLPGAIATAVSTWGGQEATPRERTFVENAQDKWLQVINRVRNLRS